MPQLLAGNADVRDVLDTLNYARDIGQKARFARFSTNVTCVWLLFMGGIILMQGFNWQGFALSTGSFVAVTTTTTLSVVGFSSLVGNYLFRGDMKSRELKKPEPAKPEKAEAAEKAKAA